MSQLPHQKLDFILLIKKKNAIRYSKQNCAENKCSILKYVQGSETESHQYIFSLNFPVIPYSHYFNTVFGFQIKCITYCIIYIYIY